MSALPIVATTQTRPARVGARGPLSPPALLYTTWEQEEALQLGGGRRGGRLPLRDQNDIYLFDFGSVTQYKYADPKLLQTSKPFFERMDFARPKKMYDSRLRKLTYFLHHHSIISFKRRMC